MLASVRNVPFMIWDGALDELVPVAGAQAQAQTFDDLGYRYVFDLFAPPVDHLALASNDEYGPAATFLGTAKVDRNPPHVTYVVNPAMDFPDDGTVADHAYWLSGLKLRDDSGAAPLGQVDARSAAFGVGDATPHATSHTLGTLTGGNLGPLEYAEQSKSWGKAPKTAKHDVLHLNATNLSDITVHRKRAHLSCSAQLDVTTDGPLTLHLPGCGQAKRFG
jgi:hypothetical protein